MILLLAACAHSLGVPTVSYGTPERLPLVRTSIDKRWYVPMEIEGEPWVWFFDTGYSHSTCDDDLIQALSLETAGRSRVRGELGVLKIPKTRLPAFTLGGHGIEGLVCQVRDLNTTSSIRDPREVRVAGVLGMDVLRPFDVRMDPLRAEVWLHPPGQGESLSELSSDSTRLRREFYVGTRVKVATTISGRTLWPILDTGASSTHLDLAAIGEEPTDVRKGVVIRGTGGSGSDVRTMEYFELPSLSLADTLTGPLRIAGRTRGPGLLGLDVLSSFIARYDFKHNLAHFERVEAGELPRWSEWRATYSWSPGSSLPSVGMEDQE